MNKKIKILAISLGSLAFTMASSIAILSSSSYSNKKYNCAMAVSDGYIMTLDSSNRPNTKYSPFEETFNINNFNNDPITFRYKRATPYSGGFMTLSGAGDGGFIYNPWSNTSSNYNGLDGISSITINYQSKNGILKLSHGMSSKTYLNTVDVVSGKEIKFNEFYPSHIKIFNQSGAGKDNEVNIISITINYHSYNFYENAESGYQEVISQKSEANIAVGSSISYSPINNAGNILDNNYLRILYTTTENIEGEISYVKTGNTKVYKEPFYLEKGQTMFYSFLDAFRNSALGNFNKTITEIKFKNVGHNTAKFNLIGVSINSRVYYRNDTYYIGDDMIRVGVSMRYGGSIVSVQNISTETGYNIQEYVTKDYQIKIRSADNNPDQINNVIKTHPNLANTFDLGREIQQSYYIGVGASNGYTQYQYNGAYRDYNPVQAGDQKYNESKVVDFKIERDETENISSIYVKTMACDWAANNSLTKSYMENTYTVSDGLVFVNNRFTDFSNFINYPYNL